MKEVSDLSAIIFWTYYITLKVHNSSLYRVINRIFIINLFLPLFYVMKYFYLLFNLMYYLCQLYPALILQVITKNFIFSQKNFIIYLLNCFFYKLSSFIADNDFEFLAYLKQRCQKYFMAMYLFMIKDFFQLTNDHSFFPSDPKLGYISL